MEGLRVRVDVNGPRASGKTALLQKLQIFLEKEGYYAQGTGFEALSAGLTRESVFFSKDRRRGRIEVS